MKYKALFIIFKGLSTKETTQFFLKGESSTLISLIFVLQSVVLIKLLSLGILFSTVVRTVVVAKSVILGILLLISFILALRAAVVAKLVKLGISF